VSTLNTRARFHSDRAEYFKRHASNTRNPQTREMYLRLAEAEMALDAKEDESVEEPEQQIPRKAKAKPGNLRAGEQRLGPPP
jgi:hypothetical protein